jgi:hypothetical protein
MRDSSSQRLTNIRVWDNLCNLQLVRWKTQSNILIRLDKRIHRPAFYAGGTSSEKVIAAKVRKNVESVQCVIVSMYGVLRRIDTMAQHNHCSARDHHGSLGHFWPVLQAYESSAAPRKDANWTLQQMAVSECQYN